MASAIIVAPMDAGAPALDAAALRYVDEAGVPRGGYACVGHVSAGQATALVRVWTDRAQMAALLTDERYLYVEEVADDD